MGCKISHQAWFAPFPHVLFNPFLDLDPTCCTTLCAVWYVAKAKNVFRSCTRWNTNRIPTSNFSFSHVGIYFSLEGTQGGILHMPTSDFSLFLIIYLFFKSETPKPCFFFFFPNTSVHDTHLYWTPQDLESLLVPEVPHWTPSTRCNFQGSNISMKSWIEM